MATTTLPLSDLPDDLPLLTEVVEAMATDEPDDLPTLTEIVVDSTDTAGDGDMASFPAPENEPVTLEPAAPEPAALEPAPLEAAIAAPDGESQPITSQGTAETAVPAPRALSDEELQQIVQHLEAHLETMLASKFSLHFEKLRDALDAHLDSKIQ